jgi:inhibitor of KinA sporulation pathway (predicted exonuclease)
MTSAYETPVLVVDLEATCWERRLAPSGERQSTHNTEIIEFGCALATRDGELLDSQSFLVRPTLNPVFSEFCKSQTSIQQSMADAAPVFSEVCDLIDVWLDQPHEDFLWCSWGNYDRLHIQADGEKHKACPSLMNYPHLNLKRLWRRTTGQKRKNGMAHALEFRAAMPPIQQNRHVAGLGNRGCSNKKRGRNRRIPAFFKTFNFADIQTSPPSLTGSRISGSRHHIDRVHGIADIGLVDHRVLHLTD